MGSSPVSSDDFLTISPRIRVMPIIHGSGDFAIQVREELLARRMTAWRCRYRRRFRRTSRTAIEQLPAISVVVQWTRRPTTTRTKRSRVQLRADRPVPGGHRRAADGAGRADPAASSSIWKRRASCRSRGLSRTLTRSKRVSPERSPPRCWRRSRLRRRARHAERVAWMAARLRELDRDTA